MSYNTGISANSPTGLVTSKARLLMCSVDLPARAQVLNMKQFNGKQGCIYWVLPAISIAIGHRVQRSHTKMKNDARQAAESGEAVRYECGCLCIIIREYVCVHIYLHVYCYVHVL